MPLSFVGSCEHIFGPFVDELRDFEDDDDVEGPGGGGGGLGGFGSGRLSARETTVTPTIGFDFDRMPLQIRPSAAGNCLESAHAEHPANLPLLSIAQEGTGSGGDWFVDLDEEAAPDVLPGTAPDEHSLAENRGPTMSPFLIGLLPTIFLQ